MKQKNTKHRRDVWESFWTGKKELDQVYSNADRVIYQIQSLGDLKGKRILEVGAGSGRDGLKLVDHSGCVVLLDYAKNSLELMKYWSAKLKKPVFLVQGDAFHLPFCDQSIDVVFHQGLLEHFRDPENILKENHRVLRKNGYALADVPQRYHIYTVVKHILIWMNKWFAGWETEFSPVQLKALFRQSGFTVYRLYGDWMRPGFFYRALREIFKKIGLSLPLYPKGLPVWRGFRDRMRQRVKKSSLSYYTFMDIGVIGRK